MMQIKHSLCIWTGGFKAASAGAGVDNVGPDPELVGLPSAEASVSATPEIIKNHLAHL